MSTVSQSFNPEVLADLRKQGLGHIADQIEHKIGISIGAIDSILSEFVTQHPACLTLKDQVKQLAAVQDAVLIHGETGTGKEIIARALGANRIKHPETGAPIGQFVAINVAAIPKELVEATLFGYKKGSFTGATNDKPGLIQHAKAGTLFLDEIGDLSLDLQCKFLRVMQDMRVRPVGSNDEEEVKCRFIAATHCDLESMVEAKTFRRDLYARLSTFVLKIPPLRERLTDVPLILKQLEPRFPVDKLDVSKLNLSLNVRSLQQIARRFTVLNEMP